MKRDYRLYVLMRNDLESMSPGRCMAQANHAASVFEHDFGAVSKCQRAEVKEWKAQTKQGFGTCIVLAASLVQIENIFNTGEMKDWIMKGWVIDPEYGIRVTQKLLHCCKKTMMPSIVVTLLITPLLMIRPSPSFGKKRHVLSFSERKNTLSPIWASYRFTKL